MTITYQNGRAVQAVLLTRTGEKIRVAIEGEDDATEFCNINGTWVSDDCEPARIEFAWETTAPEPALSEADCCCSPELAARLLHLLFVDSNDEEDVALVSPETAEAAGALKSAIALGVSRH
jgi:hypothetical protein